MMKAILVDATGHSQEQDVPDSYPTLFVPVLVRRAVSQQTPNRTASYAAENVINRRAEFRTVGRLSDGRIVYGQVEGKFQMFTLNIVERDEKAAANLLREFIINRTMNPSKILSDKRHAGGRYIEGVARPREGNFPLPLDEAAS